MVIRLFGSFGPCVGAVVTKLILTRSSSAVFSSWSGATVVKSSLESSLESIDWFDSSSTSLSSDSCEVAGLSDSAVVSSDVFVPGSLLSDVSSGCDPFGRP